MFAFTSITVSVIVYLCIVAPSASLAGKTSQRTPGTSKYYADAPQIKPTKSAHANHYNASSTNVPATLEARPRTRNRNRGTPKKVSSRKDTSKVRDSAGKTATKTVRRRSPTPTKRRRQNDEPTPEPTGDPSTATTVFIDGADAFALLLPQNAGETISDAEQDGIAYCTDGNGCGNPFPNGFITGAAYSEAADGSYVQITGCMDSSQFHFASNDDGGQFDNRFPNGAQCTFGGYGASFVELVEPSANRFCMRCCKDQDDQQNCNSHQDRDGCTTAIPGTYEFGAVSCS